eukprot:c222_g1_i1 orf=192-899(+)
MGRSRFHHHPQQQYSMNQGNGECNLKYLGFFPAALTSLCLYLSAIYEAAKDQAGPLRSGVEDVEDVLKTVLRPVVRIAEDQSTKLLDYVDKKVDEKLKLVDEHIPAFIKPIAFHAQQMLLRVEPMMDFNIKTLGLDGPTSSHVVAYNKETCSEYWTYDTFQKFVSVLHLSGVVRLLGPGAMYSAELFNHVASVLRDAQIPFSSYIPDVPVQMLEKALKASSSDTSWQLYKCDAAC